MKKIYLVDDHPMLREGLVRLIGQMPDWEVCGEASSAAVVLDSVASLRPDLVMMDLNLPDRSGLELIKDMQAIVPSIPILVFSMHDETFYAERVIRAGARGYVMKGVTTEELTDAMSQVLAGAIYLSPVVSNRILGGLTKRSGQDLHGLDRLTDREIEVFELIGQGRTTAQIAMQLKISPKTVDCHRANMKSKLNLEDSTVLLREAVLWVELGNVS